MKIEYMVDWKVTTVTKEEIEEIAKLTNLVYGEMWKRAGDAAYYRWKLFSNNHSVPNGKTALVNQLMVGFEASCHRLFHFGKEICWSTELSDAMTHPDYRRQGIWERLNSSVINSAVELGFKPVFGFPNRIALKGHIRKCSMEHFFNLWRLALPLRPESMTVEYQIPSWIAKLGFKLFLATRGVLSKAIRRLSKSIVVERIGEIGDWADDLWVKECKQNEVGVVKNANYLRWRFDENPDEYRIYRANDPAGKPLGLLVTKVRTRKNDEVFGFIADVMVPSRDRGILHQLLQEAEFDFKKDDVILVDAWSTPHPFYLNGFLSFGFLPIRRLPFIVPISQADLLRRNGWANSKLWVLTMADSDNV